MTKKEAIHNLVAILRERKIFSDRDIQRIFNEAGNKQKIEAILKKEEIPCKNCKHRRWISGIILSDGQERPKAVPDNYCLKHEQLLSDYEVYCGSLVDCFEKGD